jgi:hypothetical protein
LGATFATILWTPFATFSGVITRRHQVHTFAQSTSVMPLYAIMQRNKIMTFAKIIDALLMGARVRMMGVNNMSVCISIARSIRRVSDAFRARAK